MNVPVGLDLESLNTFFDTAQPTTLSGARHGHRGRAEGKAVGLLPKPGEDCGLCPGERDSDSDRMTRDIPRERKKENLIRSGVLVLVLLPTNHGHPPQPGLKNKNCGDHYA